MWSSWCAHAGPGDRMEPSSSPVHFRNQTIAQRSLAGASQVGDDYAAAVGLVLCIIAAHSTSGSVVFKRPRGEKDGETRVSMACGRTWSKHALRAAGLAALLCTFVSADASSPAPNSSKSSKKPVTHKSSSAAHHSSSSTARSATSSKSKKSSTHAGAHKGKKSRKTAHRGQEKIDGDRTVQIQQALIKQHYLSDAASGKWDASTEDALRRYQADNGWQNKTVPDSRALIKLGLGPSHDHLLNPESAMTTAPEPRSSGAGKSAPGPAAPAPVPNQPN